MILNLSNLVKHRGVLSKVSKEKHPQHEALYFDLENEVVYAQNPLELVACVKVSIQKEPTDLNFENFFVHTQKFLSAISRNPDNIKYTTEKNFVLSTGDVIKIPVVENSLVELPKIISEDLTGCRDLTNDEFTKYLLTASTFADTEVTAPQNGVFIVNDSIRSASDSAFYMKPLHTKSQDIALPLEFVKLIRPTLSTIGEDPLNFYQDENSVKAFNSELGIICGLPDNLEIQDFDDPEFIELMRINNYIRVSKKLLLQELDYLAPLYANTPDSRIKILVDAQYLILKVAESEVDIETKLPLTSTSEGFIFPEGSFIWISGQDMKTSVKCLEQQSHTDDITIRLIEDADTITFEDDLEQTIVQSVLEG